jgi:hypothetical protein
MARVLFSWELGGGLAHLNRISSISMMLKQKGHEIGLVLKDLYEWERFFKTREYSIYQAPYFHRPGKYPVEPVCTYGQLLHNIGFESEEALIGRLKAWNSIFLSFKPDILLFDHSPSALLAFRGIDIPKIILGTGFEIPPEKYPIPQIRGPFSLDQNKSFEDSLVSICNKALHSQGIPKITFLFNLYEADEKLILSYKELDHFQKREQGRYVGILHPPGSGYKEWVWPGTQGKRIFAYLKPFEQIMDFLDLLAETSCPVVLHMSPVPRLLRKRFENTHIYFSGTPVDMKRIGNECDFVVCHGTHDTVAYMLLQGKPLYMMPFFLEQGITCENVEKLGSGVTVKYFDLAEQKQKLYEMLEDDRRFPDSFQHSYKHYNSHYALQEIESIIDQYI